MKWDFFVVNVNSSVYQIFFNNPILSLLLPYYDEKENLSPFVHLGPGYFCHPFSFGPEMGSKPIFDLLHSYVGLKGTFFAFSFLFNFWVFFFWGGAQKTLAKLSFWASVFFFF